MSEAKVVEESITLLSVVKDSLPLLGVVVGAGLHYFFSRSAELKRHERLLRVKAYSDYLHSVGEMESIKGNPDAAKQSDALARAIAAKARICSHGSASVVKALSQFEGDPSQGLTDEKKKYFLEFVEAVRRDIGAQGVQLPQEDIEKILFGAKDAPNNTINTDT